MARAEQLKRWGCVVLAAGMLGGCGVERPEPSDAGWVVDAGPLDPLVLRVGHPGWRQPLCFSCHTQTVVYPHLDAGYAPPGCASCHGYNGAPHTNHATRENVTCLDCHAEVSHVPSYKVSDDCVVCHYHPEQP